MPNTRPGIVFDKAGVCSACNTYKNKAKVDWAARKAELEKLCEKYRKLIPGGYNCIIAVSGGKDSHFQTYYMKEVMKMKPLLVSVEDNFPMTEAGRHNIRNISEQFGCDIIAIKPNLRLQKKLMRYTFEKYLKPTWHIDRLIYTYPLHMALKFNIPLVVYGENVSYEYGGNDAAETSSALGQINNGVAADIPFEEFLALGIEEAELTLLNAPPKKELKKLDPIYLSYFAEWNSFQNYYFAKSRGFRDLTHEWERTHHVENFDQVDSRGYLVHAWCKYPKFAHAAATDYSARMVRYGLITKEKALSNIEERDHNLDPLAVRDFCEFVGYSETEFWQVINKFYNRDLFEIDRYGRWVLKSEYIAKRRKMAE
jgi:N-acetyl sugar amidotransferase